MKNPEDITSYKNWFKAKAKSKTKGGSLIKRE